jgi:hypothetical protein
MITAKGKVIEVSKDSNPELFWGIRGAGANFGVITSATYKPHRLTDDGDVFVGEYIVPVGREFEYFELMERIQPIEAKLSSFMLVNYDHTNNRVCSPPSCLLKATVVLTPYLDATPNSMGI